MDEILAKSRNRFSGQTRFTFSEYQKCKMAKVFSSTTDFFLILFKVVEKRDRKYFENYHLDLEYEKAKHNEMFGNGNQDYEESEKTNYEESGSEDDKNVESDESEDIDASKKPKQKVNGTLLSSSTNNRITFFVQITAIEPFRDGSYAAHDRNTQLGPHFDKKSNTFDRSNSV